MSWEFSDEYFNILKNYLEKNKKEREEMKRKQGADQVHTYEPKEFNLTEEELCEGAFKKYVDTYKVPMSKN